MLLPVPTGDELMIWSVLRRKLPHFGVAHQPSSVCLACPLVIPLPIQAHSDVFGGDFDGDGIDSVGMDYESKYDDFM